MGNPRAIGRLAHECGIDMVWRTIAGNFGEAEHIRLADGPPDPDDLANGLFKTAHIAIEAQAMNSINGIPLLGLGTYPLAGPEAEDAVRMALDLGIRHIDTAQMYGNEAAVGRGLKAGGAPFVVTKVDPGNVGQERFSASVKKSMDDLGGPADLLLIHWPPAEADFDAALDRLMRAKSDGLAKAVGVSNFSPAMMRRAQARTGGAMVCNQVEFHPLLDQRAIVAAGKELGIAISAYSPLKRGEALKPPEIQSIAQRLNRPPSEIVLRWIMQQGVIAIPMTTKRVNAQSNLRALDFELNAEEMAAISAVGTRAGRMVNPSWMAGRWD
jgi:2,5-diketo-D-gluconate reductase B